MPASNASIGLGLMACIADFAPQADPGPACGLRPRDYVMMPDPLTAPTVQRPTAIAVVVESTV